MNTNELKLALKTKYDPRAYALLWEVGNSTGVACSRHADALAMSLWPSRGLTLIGHEIKASRTDWVRELANPSKAEPIAQFCDQWFVVVGDKNIVKPGELPPTWGLMAPRGQGLAIVTVAPVLQPKDISKSFLAACLRRVNEQSADKAALEKARKDGFDAGLKLGDSNANHNLQEFKKLRERVRAFEEASGIKIGGTWDFNSGAKIGEAVKLVLADGHKRQERELRAIRNVAKKILEALADVPEE